MWLLKVDLRLQFGEDVVHQFGQWIHDDLEERHDVVQQNIQPVAVGLGCGGCTCGDLNSLCGGRDCAGNISFALGDPLRFAKGVRALFRLLGDAHVVVALAVVSRPDPMTAVPGLSESKALGLLRRDAEPLAAVCRLCCTAASRTICTVCLKDVTAVTVQESLITSHASHVFNWAAGGALRGRFAFPPRWWGRWRWRGR